MHPPRAPSTWQFSNDTQPGRLFLVSRQWLHLLLENRASAWLPARLLLVAQTSRLQLPAETMVSLASSNVALYLGTDQSSSSYSSLRRLDHKSVFTKMRASVGICANPVRTPARPLCSFQIDRSLRRSSQRYKHHIALLCRDLTAICDMSPA
jgi:hypothetical protein